MKKPLHRSIDGSRLINLSQQSLLNLSQRHRPEGLPTQSPVALVVEARGFKLGSLDLDLRVVEKDFHFFFTRLMIRANIHRQPAPAMLQNPA